MPKAVRHKTPIAGRGERSAKPKLTDVIVLIKTLSPIASRNARVPQQSGIREVRLLHQAGKPRAIARSRVACSFGCGARGATRERGSGSRFSMSGRAAIIPSRGWSG